MMDILFNDDRAVAVNKPSGIASIPERLPQPCVLRELEAQLGHKLYVIHRLDKGASGVILFAKDPQAHRRFCLAFEHRQVTKIYLALVIGVPKPRCGVIDRPLHIFGSGRVAVNAERGKPSTTKYETLRVCGNCSLVQARIMTGRKHQIRAHFYSLGNPLAGDTKYGEKSKTEQFPRLMLHSSRLALSLPDGYNLDITAPLKEDFTTVVEAAAQGHYG